MSFERQDLVWGFLIAAFLGVSVVVIISLELPRWSGGVVIVIAASAAAWLSFASERRFRREFATRPALDEATWLETYYSGTNLPLEIPRRLLPIYCEFFNLEPCKLHPDDYPPEIADIDTSELAKAIEKEFMVAISDGDAERILGTFDSIVRFLAARTASTSPT